MSISRLLYGFFSTNASKKVEIIGYGACAVGDLTSLILTISRCQRYWKDVVTAALPAGAFVLASIGLLYRSSGRNGDTSAENVADASISFLGTTVYSTLRFALDLYFANQRNYDEVNHESPTNEWQFAIYENSLEVAYEIFNVVEPVMVCCAMKCIERFCANYGNRQALLNADPDDVRNAPAI